jgi:hypothetical protein
MSTRSAPPGDSASDNLNVPRPFEPNPFYEKLAREQRADPALFARRYSAPTLAALTAYLKASAAAKTPATDEASAGNGR